MEKSMIKWNFQPKPKNSNKRFNISHLKHQNTRNEYRDEILYLIGNQNPPTDNQNLTY